MKQERSLVPFFVVYAVMILGVVVPVMFLRDLTGWAILAGLAPFGLLQLFALWLVLDSYTKAGPKSS